MTVNELSNGGTEQRDRPDRDACPSAYRARRTVTPTRDENKADTYTALASAVNHPDAIEPYRALFNNRMLESLSRADVSLDVVSPRPFAPPVGPYSEYGDLPLVEQWNDYAIHHPRFLYLLPKRFFYGLSGRSFQNRLSSYLEREFGVPDVFHACHIYFDGYGLLEYSKTHDVPLFTVAHGATLNEFEERSRSVQTKVRATLDGSRKVLCVSDALAENAREFVPAKRVETVPIGADPEKYPVDRRAALRRELGITPDATVALFVGQFTERKGIPDLTEVLPSLDAENAEFVFIGHGGDTEDVRQALWRSDFSNQHVYTGVTTLALRRWFALADVLVLPSRAEGRPTVIYEAMASKTAVLATRVGGIPEQVVDGETGRLVPSEDPTALASALRESLANPGRLREMGARGHQRLLEQDWTWAGHADRLTALHRDAI
jgi:glycosyltransferase involved in cell wall biosynthesis